MEPVRHNAEHKIQTTGSPVYFSLRRLHPEKHKLAKAEFQHMLQVGIIRLRYKCSRSQKRDHGDPVEISASLMLQTVPDKCPIPHLQNFIVGLQGATVFTKLDLKKNFFYHIPVAR